MLSTEETVRPPLEITPSWRWLELRIAEINAAIVRYCRANKPIPAEWWDDLEWTERRLLRLKKAGRGPRQ